MNNYIIHKNTSGLLPEELFVIGKRNNNSKRDFLFISKLLGKHIPVYPEIVKSAGFLLSSLKYGFDGTEYLECIKKHIVPSYKIYACDNGMLVIGFCETATGLGMSVASSIKGCTYLSTTRENFDDELLLNFEEEHSHATTHKIFASPELLSETNKIMLVDDEITTGNSILNLMQAIESKKHMEEYNVMTFLDWRNEQQRDRFDIFERNNNTKVNIYSLLTGELTQNDVLCIYTNPDIKEISTPVENYEFHIFPRTFKNEKDRGTQNYLSFTGKTKVSFNQISYIELWSHMTAKKIKSFLVNNEKNILVLGHGENIYIPSRVASYISQMGIHADFKTTTRSPIYIDGNIIKDAECFYDNNVKYYFYNVKEAENYDRVIMLSDVEDIPMICKNFIQIRL